MSCFFSRLNNDIPLPVAFGGNARVAIVRQCQSIGNVTKRNARKSWDFQARTPFGEDFIGARPPIIMVFEVSERAANDSTDAAQSSAQIQLIEMCGDQERMNFDVFNC